MKEQEEMKKIKELSYKQIMAIELLASGRTAVEVSREIDVAAETISVWNRKPEFRSRLNLILSKMREASNARLIALCRSAVDAIEAGFKDSSISSRDKFIMGVKFLELYRRGNIEQKVPDAEECESEKSIMRNYRLSSGIK